MWPLVVVVAREGVELLLELGDRCCAGLVVEPAFHCLLESFDFAAGRGVVGPRVFLFDVKTCEFGFESVAARFPAVSETGGEHQTVVCQSGKRCSMSGDRCPECCDDDPSGDGLVRGDRECET